MLTSDDDYFSEKTDPLSSTSVLPSAKEEFVDIFVPKSSNSSTSNLDNDHEDAYRNVLIYFFIANYFFLF